MEDYLKAYSVLDGHLLLAHSTSSYPCKIERIKSLI